MRLGAFLIVIGLMTRHELPSQSLKVLLDMDSRLLLRLVIPGVRKGVQLYHGIAPFRRSGIWLSNAS